jgi:glycosyltransferase involved in cell wall biosynthesis
MKDLKNKKILAIYRDYLSYERGTPLRVKSILSELAKDRDIRLYTASRDETPPVPSSGHLVLGTNNVSNILSLSKYARDNGIELMIFHTISAGYYMPFVAGFNPSVKRVLEMHGFSEEEGKLYGDLSTYKYYRNKLFYSLIYFLSHSITTCSDTAKEKLQSINKNTNVVYGGVDVHKFSPQHIDRERGLFTKRDTIIIGYSGNARVWQGLDFLLDAFSELVERDSRFHLHLLLSEKVDRAKIINIRNTELFPKTSHEGAAKFNAHCDVLVIPRRENTVNKLSFPSKLMEYLAMGIPVVVSKTSDMHKIIKHNENGMLFEPGDINGFIDCLMQLRDPQLRARIGKNGLETAQNYSWPVQSKLFAEIIKETFS